MKFVGVLLDAHCTCGDLLHSKFKVKHGEYNIALVKLSSKNMEHPIFPHLFVRSSGHSLQFFLNLYV